MNIEWHEGSRKKNRRVIHILIQQCQIVAAEADDFVEISLAERGKPASIRDPAANATFKNPAAFQNLHRRDGRCFGS